jgi:hypothetical protein
MNPFSVATAAGSSAQRGPAAAPHAEAEHTESDAPAAAQPSDAPPLALPQPQDLLIDQLGAGSLIVQGEAEHSDDTEDEDESVRAARIEQLDMDMLDVGALLATGRIASSHGPTPVASKATQAARTARAGGHAAPQPVSASGAGAAAPPPAAPPESVETLLARLRAGGMDAYACAICCHQMMAALAGNDAGGVDAARVEEACSGDALDVVLAALRQHASSAHMQTSGWHVSATLFKKRFDWETLVPRACAGGAVQAALACVHAHTASADAVATAFHALDLMIGCWSLAASARQLVLVAMRAHPLMVFVQERGLLLLTDATSNYARCLDPTVPRAAIAALRNHPTHAGVQHCGCRVLRACLGCEEDAEQSVRVAELLRAGALEAVMSALRTHGEDIVVVEVAYAVLVALASSSVPHATRVIQAGALALPEPRCSTDEVREFRRTLRECSQRAAAAADDVAAQLLAEEAAERAAREAGKGKAKNKAAKHKTRGAGARAGAGGASGDGASGFAEAEPEAVAPALHGGELPHAVGAAPEHAAAAPEHAAGDAAEGVTLSASAERRRRRAATKAARRTGGAAAAAGTDDVHESAAVAADAAEEVNALFSAAPPAVSGLTGAPPAGSGTSLMEELFPWMRLDAPQQQQQEAATQAPAAPPPAPAPLPALAPLPPAAPPPTDAAFEALKAALAKAEEEVDATKCVICLDAQRCTALLPCKHLPLCASPACAAMLGTPARCPLCRAVVLDSMQLFV